MRTACLLTVSRSIPMGEEVCIQEGLQLGSRHLHPGKGGWADPFWMQIPRGQTSTYENIALPQTSFAAVIM